MEGDREMAKIENARNATRENATTKRARSVFGGKSGARKECVQLEEFPLLSNPANSETD
jgi:hypothetical protein